MTTNPHPNDWNACPQGEIAGLVDSLKRQRRRKSLQQAVGATSAIVLLAFVATSLISGFFRGQTPIQSIACEMVLQLAPQYVARQLDGDVTARIDHHLTTCPHCREHIHAKYPQFPLPVRAASTWNATTLPFASASLGRFAGILVPRYQSER